MRLKTLSKFFTCIAALFASGVTFGISPILTSPRIGDSMTELRLKAEPRWTDTAQYCPDLRNTTIDNRMAMAIWQPSKNDSVTDILITRGRYIVNLVQDADTLKWHSLLSPGRKRIFDTNPVYGVPFKSSLNEDVSTHGSIDNVTNFSTKGHWRTTKIDNLSLITFSGDTLVDVVCIQVDVIEEIIHDGYEEPDTTEYRGCIRTWYAPGYRYPILTNEKGALYDPGWVHDRVDTWTAIDPDEQSDNIKDDFVNELIRNRYKNGGEPKNDTKLPGNFHNVENLPANSLVYYDKNNNFVVINPSMRGDSPQSFILCDISGIVYDHGDVPASGLQIPTDDLLPGTYLVHISGAEEPIIYKFRIENQ